MNTAPLDALLATHAATIRPLLPAHLWPPVPFKVEQFGALTKYTVGQLADGRWPMFHYIAQADEGPPHSHPCQMEAHGIAGSYLERVYHGDGRTEDRVWAAGSSHVIAPDCVHQLLSVSAGGVWTLCFASPVVQAWRHYPELL